MREIDETEEKLARQRQEKRKMLALAALGVIGISLYGWWSKTIAPPPAVMVSRNEIAEAAHKAQSEVVVYVSGLVEHPGVVKVNAGTRALDAVNAAGGLLPGADVSKVNLAQAVRDGMQIHVPGQPNMLRESGTGQYKGPGEEQSHSNFSPSALAAKEEKININTADAAELDKLPGVGPAMAEKIVEWRKANGGFKDGEDLKKVKGIGEGKYQKLKDKISW